MTAGTSTSDLDDRDESRGAVPQDEGAALESVENGEAVGIPSLGGVLRGLTLALGQAKPLGREAARLAVDCAKIVRGTEEHRPSPKDKRFADPAWSQNPAYRRLSQAYLAAGGAASRLVDDLEAQETDWHDVERARFAVNALTSALAPTNTLLGNPAALKRAFETAGGSVVHGLRHFAHDVRHNGGMPSQTDRTAFTVGKDLAITPGAVVARDDVAELIQYTPSTPNVRARPVLVIPPPIGRYYFLDLRPGRSLVEYAVSQGLQVFMISWRNPQAEQADWGLDVYVRRILDALDSVSEITGSDDVNTLGFCAGGILMSTALSHLAHVGPPRVHSASYGVTLLDFDSQAPLGAFSAPRMLEMARSDSKRKGIISARSLGTVFSWMRPDDLVFNYVVNQWLMGNDPPIFDILAWNADGTNLPARLHEQFLDIFQNNTLTRAGGVTVLDQPVDLSRVTVPTFVTGAINDHLTPWDGCYRTTALMSGPSTYVLSNAGHIASLVNPPGNPKASYWVGGEPGPDAEAWRAAAEKRTGSWWEAWSEWIVQHAGDEVPAPSALGSERHPPLEAAPGSYVLDRIPPAAKPDAKPGRKAPASRASGGGASGGRASGGRASGGGASGGRASGGAAAKAAEPGAPKRVAAKRAAGKPPAGKQAAAKQVAGKQAAAKQAASEPTAAGSASTGARAAAPGVSEPASAQGEGVSREGKE